MDDVVIPADERMTAADLVLVLRWLGLDQRALSQILGVDERTVRRWVAGDFAISDSARLAVEDLEASTAAAVGQVVDALRDDPDPTVVIYRTSEAMWADRPDLHPYPATWWTMICARAVHEIPGVAIVFAEDVHDG